MSPLRMSVLAAGLIYGTTVAVQAAEVVKVSLSPWCPYICTDPVKPGALIETITAAFATKGLQVRYIDVPWTRQIAMVRKGEVDAMSGVGKADVPDLVFPARSTGRYQPCFYTLANSTWQYEGIPSLKNIRLSVLKDTTFSKEVDEYINGEGKRSGKVDFLHDEDYLTQHFRKLEAKRVDVVLDDATVVNHFLNEKRLAKPRQAGCLKASALWLGFSPVGKNTKTYLAAYEQGLETIRKSGQLKAILGKYGIDELSF
ncbi:substrate-binding periplasmic protein [Chitinimonas lacunae]|uniref:Substrate-binding periplasmic protein n=1 Tax=Chitinimonas lacunae TaxID=1963018 RepID=A0ABV8MVJ8_9NEIS